MMNVIKEIMNSDAGILISFILTIISMLQIFLPKSVKDKLAKLISQNTFKSWTLILIYLIIGLIAPILLIFKSFSDWTGWSFWLTQILSWYSLASFILLVFMMFSLIKIVKDLKE